MRLTLCHCALMGAIFVSRAFPSACAITTLNVYDAAGFTCTINGEIVENFTFSVPTMSSGYSPLLDSQIMVTPSFPANRYQLFFSPVSPNGFNLTGTQFVQYEFNFTWDPVVEGAEDDMASQTPVSPGFATVTTNLCAGSTFGAGCPPPTNTLFVMNNGISSIPTAVTYFAAPVTVVDTQSLLTLNANGASSEIAGFSTSVFTPEPGAALLVLTGLLGLLSRRLIRGWLQPTLQPIPQIRVRTCR